MKKVVGYGISCYKCLGGWKFKNEWELAPYMQCPNCGRVLDPDDKFWICSCGAHNDLTNNSCYKCGSNENKKSWW